MDTTTDICARKHRQNPQSAAANPSDSQKQIRRKQILLILRFRGATGATTDELSALFNVPPNEVSGRTAELKRDGQIIDSGRRRQTRRDKAAAVLILPEFAEAT